MKKDLHEDDVRGKSSPQQSKSKRSKAKNKRRSYSSRSNEHDMTDKSTNDPAWYGSSPELIRDAASIPFSWSVGTRLYWGGDKVVNDTIPTVLAMPLIQTIGNTTQRTSPANVASDAIYTFVRHANSGHSNYDAPDLMMYLISMSTIYSYVTWCQRLLGMVTCYDQRNRGIPETLFQVNEVDFNDFKKNIADFRYWLNTFITKVGSFAIPAVMPYFSRMAFLYSNYYTDGPSIKDQLYMFVPKHDKWLQFQIDSETSLGSVVYTTMPGGSLKKTWEIQQFGETLFSAIWAQEDFGIMSGDILKAYGQNIIKLATVPQDFTLPPVYDQMFLHQFKNAKPLESEVLLLGNIKQLESGLIIQSCIIQGSSTEVTSYYTSAYNMNKVLSSDFDNPTPEVVIESTRLMPACIADRVYSGSEIPVSQLRIGHIGVNGYAQVHTVYSTYSMQTSSLLPYNTNFALDMAYLNNFRYCPEITIARNTNGSIDDSTCLKIFNVDNYAVLNNYDLEKMHEAALMNLMAVPSIGKI